MRLVALIVGFGLLTGSCAGDDGVFAGLLLIFVSLFHDCKKAS